MPGIWHVFRIAVCSGVLCAWAGSVAGTAFAQEPSDPVVVFEKDDPVMAEAVANARSTLENVLERVSTRALPVEALQLKVAIPKDGGGNENIWLDNVVRLDEATFEGLLANVPKALPGRKQGDRHRFSGDEITDWMFVANGRIHGAYTLRVMLPRLPAEQAAQMRAMLAPLP
ncbi:MAG: YegJ family protein [Paracoccaceae bacterium]